MTVAMIHSANSSHTEGRSTGIPKILRNMAENGSPAPVFETDDERSSYLVRLPVHSAMTAQEAQAEAQDALSGHQVEILHNCLTERPIAELMKIKGRSDRTKFRNQVLNPLLADGLVERTIPEKRTSPNQTYRLTQKGCDVIENLVNDEN